MNDNNPPVANMNTFEGMRLSDQHIMRNGKIELIDKSPRKQLDMTAIWRKKLGLPPKDSK